MGRTEDDHAGALADAWRRGDKKTIALLALPMLLVVAFIAITLFNMISDLFR